VGEAVHGIVPEGQTVAVISAGWQEAENDLDEIGQVVDRPLVDLMIYARCDTLLNQSPELGEAHRRRQVALRALQRLYRRRLGHLIDACVEIFEVESELAQLDQRHAVTQVRALDRHHLQRVRAAHLEYAQVESATNLAARTRLRGEVASVLDGGTTVIVTGGNIGVLMSRLRLLGMSELLAGKNIVAWSAGAMAMCERVVLYHDLAPQGQRDAELFDEGLGLVPGYVALPNAKRRLDKSQTTRLGLMSRRLAPRRTVTLDSGSMLTFDDARLAAVRGSMRLSRTGVLKKVRTR
jgi:hypothetical protein